MRKLVYLFELDSVWNTDAQMERAMSAVFREIVMNGNAVAITYNQLFDSRFFLSLLNDDAWSDCIMKLFRLGALRISQFGKYRSPSQYLINSALESSEEYIFSGLPIRSAQKSLVALTKRSLMYSDLTELNEYINGQRSEAEKKTLFREQRKENRNGRTTVSICETSLSNQEIMNTLRDLRAVLKLVLNLGDMQKAYNPPKDFDAAKEKLTMCDFIGRALQLDMDIREWNDAVRLLNMSVKNAKNPNKRSDVLKKIRESCADGSDTPVSVGAVAQAILDLCYNYACEASISNVSKHYNVGEFKEAEAKNETFTADFKARFRLYYGNERQRIEHFLAEESNDFNPYQFKNRWFCNLKRAEHLAGYAELYAEQEPAADSVLPYEHRLYLQRLRQRALILSGVGKKLLITIIYLFAAFYIENNVYSIIEQMLDDRFETALSAGGHSWLVAVAASMLAAAIVELVSGYISKMLKYSGDYTRENGRKHRLRLDIPSFGESLENMISQLGDIVCAIITIRSPYYNKANMRKMSETPRDKTRRIDFVSGSVADYKQFRKKAGENESDGWMFGSSDRIPLVNIMAPGEDARLTRIEELTGKTFGITHKTAFHTMLVDPAVKIGEEYTALSDNAIYPYERLTALHGPGIVSVPVIYREGKPHFVLLEQYRHAIRSTQFGFPRGFGEKGLTPIRNTQKELWEEIGAVLREPNTGRALCYGDDGCGDDALAAACCELGRYTVDSGSLCDSVCVIRAELFSYSINEGHEGIISSIEVSEDELRQMILDGRINDSFTIGAFSLWKLRENTL